MKRSLFIAIALVLFSPAWADVGSGSLTSVSTVSPGPNFTLNPNPVTGSYFNINLDFKETDFPEAKVTITSVLGQVVYTAPVKKTEFATGSVHIELADARLSKGMYFVQISSGESTKTQKLAVR